MPYVPSPTCEAKRYRERVRRGEGGTTGERADQLSAERAEDSYEERAFSSFSYCSIWSPAAAKEMHTKGGNKKPKGGGGGAREVGG